MGNGNRWQSKFKRSGLWSFAGFIYVPAYSRGAQYVSSYKAVCDLVFAAGKLTGRSSGRRSASNILKEFFHFSHRVF
jgi:hypothetical protein